MKLSRTFYFLRDSVTGSFYTGQSNVILEFSDAAIYVQYKNAEKKIKDIVRSWEHQHKYANYWIEESKSKEITSQEWAKKQKDDVDLRKDLPQWGIEIVSVRCTFNELKQ